MTWRRFRGDGRSDDRSPTSWRWGNLGNLSLLWLLALLAFLVGVATPAAAKDPGLKERYELILEHWATAPSADAVYALAELEADRDVRTDVLTLVVKKVDAGLVRKDPMASVALAHLHAQAYTAVLRGWRPDPGRRQEPLQESAEMARMQLNRLIDRVRKVEGPEGAAKLLAALGFSLSELPSHHHHRAWSTFEKALEVDSQLGVARLGMAFLDERRGNYGDSAVTLRQMLRNEPNHPEARLRFAISQAQRGEMASALEELERVVGETGPDWVRTVAYQELVRWNQPRHPEVALQWLEAGLEAFPGDPRLQLQHAFAGHRQWDESTRKVVAWVDGWRPQRDPSPRFRYDLGPIDDRSALMAEMSDQLGRSLPGFRQVVLGTDAASRSTTAATATLAETTASETAAAAANGMAAAGEVGR